MGLSRNQIDKGSIRKLFPKPKAGVHRKMKKALNRLIRRNELNVPSSGRFRPTKGWEY